MVRIVKPLAAAAVITGCRTLDVNQCCIKSNCVNHSIRFDGVGNVLFNISAAQFIVNKLNFIVMKLKFRLKFL
jgi:hypothetical protein